MLTERRLLPFSREVLVEAHRATDFATRAAASLLHAGPLAALYGLSSLAMFGCSAADRAPIHVLVPYQRKLRHRPGLIVHQGRFDAFDVDELDGLRVTSMDFALAEVLCRGDRRTGLACADQALALLPESERTTFRAWTEERILARSDPRGIRRALFLLNLATGLAESPPESWTLLDLIDAGLPVPVLQFPVCDLAGNEIYRLDFAWPEIRVAVEYDGYEAHEHRISRDAARDEDLRRRGWMVIRADAADLKNPSRLITAVEAAFRVRGLAA
ncbi:MAG: hypothetical protein JWQ81_4854 [Amycolatopsis sp.]|nr:hypothetical protein [Amycolatopsis sp.]